MAGLRRYAAAMTGVTERSIQLLTPDEPLYLQSWVRVPVQVPVGVPGVDPTFDDLLFLVEPPDVGCGVSHSRDGTFDADSPDMVLYVGSMAGEFTLRAIDERSGEEVASAPFSVSYGWPGVDGPPLRVIGETGGPSVLFDAVGTWKVAIVLLETTDVSPLSDDEATALLTKFENEIFNGVSVSGQVESAAVYHAQMSWQKFHWENVGVVGPVRLSADWNTVNPVWDTDRNLWRGCLEFSKAGMAEVISINRARAESGDPPLVDLTDVNTVIFVVRAFNGPPGGHRRSIWPWATGPGGLRGNYDVDGDPNTPDRLIESFVMPDDWPNPAAGADAGGRIRYTAAHEMCHNLGLPDQYTGKGTGADYVGRDVTEWSLMSNEQRFPNLSVPERRQLGWLEDRQIRTLKPDPATGALDTTVTLRVASQRPRPGEFTGVEIKRSGATSYFLELRGKSAGTIPDRDHTPQVLGTDWADAAPTDRPKLLRMRNDADNDRGTYQAGDDYAEDTTAKPEYPVDLGIEVLTLTADTAKLRIRYGDRRADPSITPFSEALHWQSPDIVVVPTDRPALNPGDPNYNVPWIDHKNTVIARVKNDGKLRAKQARVEYSWADFTLSLDAPFQFFGADQQDIDPGDTVEFLAEFWYPKPGRNAHYCVKAEIIPYDEDGIPGTEESTTANNVAQSNYSRFISKTASPASRESASVALYGDPAGLRQYVNVRQTSPFARTFLDHQWVDVAPGHRRDVTVFTEFMVGDHSVQEYVDSLGGIEEAFRTPNQLDLSAAVVTGCSASLLGGAGITVPVALRTRFTDFGIEPGGSYAYGTVGGPSGPASDGPVLVSVRPHDDPEQEVVFTTDLQGGRFGVDTPHGLSGRVTFRGHYLGVEAWAPCDSRVVTDDV
jgi:M6 family metalloprotease-like protein